MLTEPPKRVKGKMVQIFLTRMLGMELNDQAILCAPPTSVFQHRRCNVLTSATVPIILCVAPFANLRPSVWLTVCLLRFWPWTPLSGLAPGKLYQIYVAASLHLARPGFLTLTLTRTFNLSMTIT